MYAPGHAVSNCCGSLYFPQSHMSDLQAQNDQHKQQVTRPCCSAVCMSSFSVYNSYCSQHCNNIGGWQPGNRITFHDVSAISGHSSLLLHTCIHHQLHSQAKELKSSLRDSRRDLEKASMFAWKRVFVLFNCFSNEFDLVFHFSLSQITLAQLSVFPLVSIQYQRDFTELQSQNDSLAAERMALKQVHWCTFVYSAQLVTWKYHALLWEISHWPT